MTFTRKSARRLTLSTLSIAVVTALTFSTGCQKEQPDKNNKSLNPRAHAMVAPESDLTDYFSAPVDQVLGDVVSNGNRLEFRNTSHFLATARVLDSLGDSTANNWAQSIGFPNSLYNEFQNAMNNVPPDVDDAGYDQYLSGQSNSVHYDAAAGEWTINAACGTFARLLSTDHKATIGGNVFYSDYNADVTVGLPDEPTIPMYATQADEQDDEQAIVVHQRVGLKTTGTLCIGPGWDYYLGEINCGSPIQKRSRIWFSARKFLGPGSTPYTIGVVSVYHDRRAIFGSWRAESRGSQVSGTFNGVYRNMFKIWGNSATYHEYMVTLDWGWVNVCAVNLAVCVAPMCGGVTLCRYW